jgi:hypothetical protein
LNRRRSLLMLVLFLVVGLIVGVASQAATAASPTKVVALQLVTHVQAGFAEQDVFVERNDIPAGTVRRLTIAESQDVGDRAKMLFASSQAVQPDPYKTGPNPLGPFPKGNPIGISAGAWVSATATGTYTVTGTKAELKLDLRDLAVHGVYTVRFARMTLSPAVKVEDLPAGKDAGTNGVSFKADAKGNATVDLKLAALPGSTQDTATVISVVYHSDGVTHGASQGDFGLNAHTQLFYMFPAAAGAFFTPIPPTPAAPPTPAVIQSGHGAGHVCGSCHKV